MKFQFYKSGEEWRWRLRAINGEIIASGEGYKNKLDCLNAIGLVKESAQAPVERIGPGSNLEVTNE